MHRGKAHGQNGADRGYQLWAECMISSEYLTTGTTAFYTRGPVFLIGDGFLFAA